ncbi:sugar kinase [Rhodococcus sp. RS1C4]|uniref:ROK family protein n=1 Tax=Nocardiaceae TaxID=85025 RepID=UPI00035EB62B|nr:sugar kinase [Rhodococcus sp. RS1C4]OZC57380.1 sugar kinase [Rhodococcus sp. 06-621-2]OZC80869.1 sugar kinase [Rhodococcus sp. 06-418-1B]OZD14358.1 sugar kinase [Rhodococcus sp. 06-156-3C]OZD16046.1 sugar kinase [Rhodococcus sp. 06-156-4C]OZD24692.1 sugar kinase [Rhodococcus sp. 06-156-3b]OZD28647.1 sugar kinase [Rhodococcus sp. 06-156-4a]OZD36975.1 sugar kinase [Rhodococcus sp. 06-156-3]OZD58863.1 sugar kinase [Rhodococcus sp. 06-1059B-a]OZF03070.1 sugar kinase [Rhodococcus sp. 15-1154
MSRASAPPATAGEMFALIRDGDADTRADLGKTTGLSRSAVAARVTALTTLGLIVETEDTLSTGGRPPARLSFDVDAGIVLAAAIGRSRSQLGVFTLGGEFLLGDTVDQEIGIGPDELMPQITKRLEALVDDAARSDHRILGVGLSIPGTADTARGCSLDSPIMHGWDGVPLAPFFADTTDAPVFLDNDANAMVLAERRDNRHRFTNALLVKASTGLGAGIVAGGELQRGSLGAAGEFGHTKTSAAAGVACRCGDSGCLEAIAGGWALVRALQEQGRSVGHIRGVVDLAVSGDPEARRLIRDSGRHIGETLAGAVNLLNPEVLIVGGDMAKAYDIFVAGLRETVYGNATALATKALTIQATTHGDYSGVIGSAAMVLDQVLSARAVDDALGG